mgnify:CR=1 FL=1
MLPKEVYTEGEEKLVKNCFLKEHIGAFLKPYSKFQHTLNKVKRRVHFPKI